MNPYQDFVSTHARLVGEGRQLPLGGFPPLPRPALAADAPKALFFAPHPDDECIGGAAVLRLMREAGMRVVNVAITLGRKPERKAGRLQELQNACNFIGFDLELTAPEGLDHIDPRTRKTDLAHWERCVGVIVEILRKHQPRVVVCPHEHDWNSTHIGTHFLVMDALSRVANEFECFVIENEFWGQMTTPNLLVEISERDVADMIAATTFHVVEVQRNPYHLLLPAGLMDNVRRGAELVGGQGGAAPTFTFAAVYRLRKWKGGGLSDLYQGGKFVSASSNIGDLCR